MAQVRGTFAELYDNVDKAVTAILRKSLKELQPIWRNYYVIETSTRKFERVTTVTPFGAFPEKGEGEIYGTDIIRRGWTKDFTALEFGLAFEVTETAEEDDQYDQISQGAYWLAFSARVAEETRAAVPLNEGFTATTGELTGDGQPVFSTAHVLRGGGTAANRPAAAADLSPQSLMDALIDVQTQTKIESGQLVNPINEYWLVVHPKNEFVAERILASTLQAGTPNNDINAIRTRRRITPIVNPYIDAANDDMWALIPKSKQMHGLCSYTRVPIGQKPMRIDPWTENRIYKVRFRRSWGVKWWQGLYGVPGS
jgi:hypothetical protein